MINIKNKYKIKNRGSIYKLNNADFLGHINIAILWISYGYLSLVIYIYSYIIFRF